MDGKLEKADLHYLGKSNRARAFADSYSKVRKQDVHFYFNGFCLSLVVDNADKTVDSVFHQY